MRSISFFLIGLTAFLFTSAQEPYAVSRIPVALLKNANVVKRVETVRFEIFSTKRAVLTTKYAFTILNENGDPYSGLDEYYSPMQQITSIEGALYDAGGKQIKKLKSKDIQDMSAVSDGSIMDDSRIKQHNFNYRSYPYTVEYETEVVFNHSFFFPGWHAHDFQNESVEISVLEVMAPSDYQLRYRSINYQGEPVKKVENGKTTYRWQAAALPALQKEPYGPKWHQMTTTVLLAPTAFELHGFKGDMTSWKEFGKFLYQLSLQRDVLPDAVKQKVKDITAGKPDDRSKVIALYDYLQQNTRYISIQLGIGGWQPFEASYVAQKGFGDCKALSNYMFSLLKEAGIRSNYALIRAGRTEYEMQEDFPSNQFNHAIVCVPLKNDTMWLECTSQTAVAGYMGDFTGNRKALLIDENGGVLVSTPRYTAATNLQGRKAIGKVQEDGSLELTVNTVYKGLQEDYYHGMIHALTKEKINEFLQEAFDLSTYHINSFDYQETRTTIPEMKEALQLTVSGYATITGKRLFIVPNVLNRSRTKLNADDERKQPIQLDYGYTDIDTFEIEIPSGYEVEAMPQAVQLKTQFGTYNSSVVLKDNRVIYIRKQVYAAGKFPSSDYKSFVNYFSEIYKADRNKMVLVKKEGEVQGNKSF
jgi:transglutaminase-like putative cysteine protease